MIDSPIINIASLHHDSMNPSRVERTVRRLLDGSLFLLNGRREQ